MSSTCLSGCMNGVHAFGCPNQGRKDDANKPRFSLLPRRALWAVVGVLEYGAKKYEPGNWKHVSDAGTRYLDAAHRHLKAWADGETRDPESGHPHLAHAACCVLFLLAFEQGDVE